MIEGELPRQRMPVIPGHQVVGEVDCLGPGCHRLAPASGWALPGCGTPAGSARSAQAVKKTSAKHPWFTGYHADGGYAEYAIVPEMFAYAIPDAFTDVNATPLLCAGIIGYRALSRSQLRPGGTLAIFGFGSSATRGDPDRDFIAAAACWW